MEQKKASSKPRLGIKGFLRKLRLGIKEFVRKFFVSLKRSPQNIPLVALVAAFLIYSLNLTSIANTTAKINSPNMGQCEFAAMLFSILAFVCFIRAKAAESNAGAPLPDVWHHDICGLCLYQED